jgi:hypothetical protein
VGTQQEVASDPSLIMTGERQNGNGQKKVLVISFSQSGQLSDILTSLLAPLRRSPSLIIDHRTLKPRTPFPFPWPAYEFLDVFPEAFRQIPFPLEPLELDRGYDLVIIAYQVWYLSPSIPISSFLQSSAAPALLSDTPIITVVACRNMWVRAHEQVKTRLRAVGADLVGHIVLTDRAPNLVSAITIVTWMLTGERHRLFGLFFKPGVSDADIAQCARFGEAIVDALTATRILNLQDRLNSTGACKVVPHLLSLERIADRIFKTWSAWIMKRGGLGDRRRKPLVVMFGCYLIVALIVASPLSFLLFHLTAPFRARSPAELTRHVATDG